MKLLKRLTTPLVALVLVGLFAGCSQIPPDDGPSAGLTGKDKARVKARMTKEQAEALLTASMAQTSQALALAQQALATKQMVKGRRLGPVPIRKAAAPAVEAPKAVEVPAADAKHAPAAKTGPAVPAAAEGKAAEPAAPVPPELKDAEAMASLLVDQAYALVESVKKSVTALKDKNVQVAKDKLAVLERFVASTAEIVLVAASVAPRNENILKLVEAAAAPPAAAAPKGEAPKGEAPKGEAPKAEAPKGEAPKGEAPKGEAPKADAKAEAPKADPAKAAPKGVAAPAPITGKTTNIEVKMPPEMEH